LPTDKRELAALLGGLCLFFSTIEYLIPKPVPYIRLGLANIPILLGLDLLPVGYIFLITAVKVIGQGLLNGTFASYVFLFSLSGSIASTCVMILAHRIGRNAISLLGVSILGALASNAVQILLSIQFIFGSNARIIAPVFLGFGTASGIAMGIFALVFVRRSKWYQAIHAKFSNRPV
jgi:heptaprenyl diphosphate synthase